MVFGSHPISGILVWEGVISDQRGGFILDRSKSNGYASERDIYHIFEIWVEIVWLV